MLKHLSIFTTAAIIHVVLLATTASAAPISDSASADKLIVKGEKIKLNQPATVTPADLQSIQQTLTQFYRGINEGNIKRINKVVTLDEEDRHVLESLFSEIKSAGGDWSIEVKNIELVSFVDRHAMMRVDEIHKFSVSRREVDRRYSSTILRLAKLKGQWQVTSIQGNLSR
jgi:hypothetical protein